MPAEWEEHEATWLAWPHNRKTWPGKRLAAVRDIYLQMLEAILDGEKAHVLVNGEREGNDVLKSLQGKADLRNLRIHEIPTADAWIRDYGPTFVRRVNEKAWCKWSFNAWGEKYPSVVEDTHVFEKGASLIGSPSFSAPFVLEGGSIEVNGEGTCLTTEQCLLNPNRNPQLSRPQIEKNLLDYLGVDQIVWIKEGIVGDATDGHVDNIVRLLDSTTIASVYQEDQSDVNHRILHDNWQRLEKVVKEQGGKWQLIRLPMPGPVVDGGVRLPASYANFYISNKAVLVPVYGHRNDARVIKILRECFPRREVVPIVCTALVYGLGAIHCVTQQEPL